MTLDTIYNENCLDTLARMPDASIDCVITDPPYLINYKTGHRHDKTHDFCSAIEGDDDNKLIIDYLAECHRVLKYNTAMYMFCSAARVDFFKREVERHFTLKNIIIWVKNNWSAGDLDAAFARSYEFLLMANKGRAAIRTQRWSDVWYANRVAGAGQRHQNQKPLFIITRALQAHTAAGDVVFDGFMGSGTTAVACVKSGRHYVGSEIEPRYYDMAVERVAQAAKEVERGR